MAQRIKLSDRPIKRPIKRIVFKDAPARRVPTAGLGDRLGAEVVGSAPVRGGAPLSRAALREEVFHRLRSTGGRPGLEGTDRKKIPLTARDWEMVERVANDISEPGFRPSPMQVASIVLSVALRQMDESMEEAVKRRLKTTA